MSSLDFTIEAGGGPPPGNYRGEFLGIEDVVHEEYGPGKKWSWRVVDGPQAGVIASRTTPVKPTTGNACGKMIAAMTGMTITSGQKGSLKGLVGKVFLLQVAQTKSGNGTRVETAMPL